jgi:NADH-quinone oxidoreductase subunit N
MNPQSSYLDFYLSGFAEITLAFYLLAYIAYAAVYGSLKIFGHPTLLKPKTGFTIFTLVSILLAFGSTGSDFCFSFFNGASNVTFFTFVMRTILLISSIALLYISRDYLSACGIVKYEYDLLIVFSVASLILLGYSGDFLVVYLAIELQSLSFYVLATFQKNSEFSTEAGLKYFVLGALSSGLLLFGFALIYTTFGATSLETLAKLASASDNVLAF